MSTDPNLEFEDVEKKLRKFRPAEPSPRLTRRLESSVSMPSFDGHRESAPEAEKPENIVAVPQSFWVQPWLRHVAAAIIGAGVALALFAFDGSGSPEVSKDTDEKSPIAERDEPKPITPTFEPGSLRPEGFRLAGQENQLYDSHDDGIIYSHDQIPFRRVRYNTLDRRVFRDPESGAVFELTVPREDVLIVPAETF